MKYKIQYPVSLFVSEEPQLFRPLLFFDIPSSAGLPVLSYLPDYKHFGGLESTVFNIL